MKMTCNNCNKMGHLQAVCKGTPNAAKTTKTGRVTVDNGVVARKVASTKVVDDSDPIPMMENVKVEAIVTDKKQMKKTRPTTMEIFPDSGCQETLISEDLVGHLGLILDQQRKKQIKGIDGKTSVPCLGSTSFRVTYDGQQTNVLALVTSSLSNEIVLSWRALQRLGVLPEDYPRSQFVKAQKANMSSLKNQQICQPRTRRNPLMTSLTYIRPSETSRRSTTWSSVTQTS